MTTPETRPDATAGDAYDRVVLAALGEHLFDLEDYDAETAAREAAYDIPQLSKFIRDLIAADTAEENGS